MAKVDADPQSLRELRGKIRRGRDDIDRAVAGMRAGLQAAHWNDDRKRQFEQELDSLLRSVSSFAQKTNDLEAYLSRKADALETYLAR